MKDYILKYIYIITDAIIAGFMLLQIIVILGISLSLLDSQFSGSFERQLFILSILVLSFIASLYFIFLDPQNIVVKTVELEIKNYTADPIKFAVISDLHLGRFNNIEKLKKTIVEINRTEDLSGVLILGDVINNESKYLNQLDILKLVDKKLPIYFVYGNHDFPSLIDNNNQIPTTPIQGLPQKLKDLNINILENKSVKVGTNLYLVGLSDIWSQNYNPELIKKFKATDNLIVLGHNPDTILDLCSDPLIKDKVDLLLSGHTHGGEMRLPIIGSLSDLPTKLPNKYDQGLLKYENIPMYITSGVGSVGVRLRTDNNPEVIILTIK